MTTKTKEQTMPIKTYLNKAEGLEVTVRMLKSGMYAVVLWDIDEMRYLPMPEQVFLSRDVAIAFAQECVS